ncbi:hypothetical protein M378DRAFT_15738 [Amanita muscaria Koide BX008]|uniref:Uncharacterized protein n=1 Tax=Amanita muscaria (strain Koide BX008) TaxID=946122 RepID=A0A0C2WAA1_AMAMK|nr:hypothetical protein M378DRAFT_15738 [Amanita muscaria Koide BX008]
MVSLTESYVTALVVQASLYGLYVTTFWICLRWLMLADKGWGLRRPFDWPMLVAAIIIFASFTTWFGANARLTMEYVRGVKLDLSHVYVVGAVIISGTAGIILTTDAVVIYRCWKVYNKSWRIIALPVLFWLGSSISFILVFYYNHQEFTALDDADFDMVLMWATKSSYAHPVFRPFNALTNIYTTAAIIYRVKRDASKRSGHSFKRLQHLCRILAEIESLYTLTTIPPLVAFFQLDPNKYLVLLEATEAVNFSMAGIAFNLVLIRVGQSRADAAGTCLVCQASDQRLLLEPRHRHRSSTEGQSITQDAA